MYIFIILKSNKKNKLFLVKEIADIASHGNMFHSLALNLILESKMKLEIVHISETLFWNISLYVQIVVNLLTDILQYIFY